MDAISRLKMLSAQTSFEPDGDSPLGPDRSRVPACIERRANDLYLSPAVMSGGGKILLLKSQLSSVCERDCHYCAFRAGRDFRRATFKPEEFAGVFMELYRRKAVDGLFVSSGIAGGGVRTQDKLLDTADILRRKLGYRGYLHLKIMPGAEKEQVYRAMQLADRVSVNLEAPNTARLAQLAPRKQFLEELIRPLRWVEEIRRSIPPIRAWKEHWPSSTTQFVAGGADESDVELLQTTQYLYGELRLKRTYFMAFSPVPDTPLENHEPTSGQRELRLYQASFLLRDYGFDLEEMPFEQDGNLPLAADPKLAWARANLAHSPIEINTADKRTLLRVPGIGLKGAEEILKIRRQHKLHDLGALRKIGIAADRAAPFVLLDGHQPAYQLGMM
jgi:predicted DNA-binding helix-hairpin-helix protein